MRLLLAIVLVTLTACVPDGPDPGVDKEHRKVAPAKAKRRAPRPRASGLPPALRPPASARPSAAARATPSKDPLLTAPFEDTFDRSRLGDDWLKTSPVWKIDDGRLCGQRARNHPVWLRRRLPNNARIEFDATSMSPDGDIKAEFWGNGRGFARAASYDHATSYLTIFGGWKNQFHVLARMDEHAKDRPEIRLEQPTDDPKRQKVEPNRTYHFKVERSDGKTVRWFVDDVEILTYPDEAPLAGPGHDHFGFNDWDVRVCFDNLKITPLPG